MAPALAYAFLILHVLDIFEMVSSRRIPETVGTNVACIRLTSTTDMDKLPEYTEIKMTTNNTFSTPIHEAAQNGNLTQLEDLLCLECDYDIDNKDVGGVTAVYRAAQMGQVVVLRWLLGRGADPNVRNDKGDTLLHIAAINGHLEAAKGLLTVGAQVNLRGLMKRTPLHWAAITSSKGMVELLLGNGAKPNMKDVEGFTALHWASRTGNEEIVKLLLTKGAFPNPRNTQGITPLHLAAKRGHGEIVKLLLGRVEPNLSTNMASDGRTPLHEAARGGHPRVVQLLVDAGMKLNAADILGTTPLHLTIQGMINITEVPIRSEIVKYLIAQGGDVNLKDVCRYTPSSYFQNIVQIVNEPVGTNVLEETVAKLSKDINQVHNTSQNE